MCKFQENTILLNTHLGIDYEVVNAAKPKIKVIVAEFVRIPTNIRCGGSVSDVVIAANAHNRNGWVQSAKGSCKSETNG